MNSFQLFGVFLVVVAIGIFLLDRLTDFLPVIGWLDNFILLPLAFIFGVIGALLVIFGGVIEKAFIALALVAMGWFLLSKDKKFLNRRR